MTIFGGGGKQATETAGESKQMRDLTKKRLQVDH